MNINWFVVFAQIINFLILVVLLKKFLYRPIINAMDQREQNLIRLQQETHQKNIASEEIKQSYLVKIKEWENEKQILFTKAKQKADEERKKLIHEAHQHVNLLEKKWQEALLSEQEDFLNKLSKQISENLLAITRHVMADLVDRDLQTQFVLTFCRKLKDLAPENKQQLISSYQQNGQPLTIRTNFDLSEKEKKILQESVNKILSNESDIVFKTDPSLVMTLELEVNSQKIVWGLDEYLAALKKNILNILETQKEISVEKIIPPTPEKTSHA